MSSWNPCCNGMAFLKDNIVFSFCSSALRICRVTLLPSLVSHAFADHLVKSGRALFDETMPMLSSGELELQERFGEVFIKQAIGIEDVLQAMLEQEMDWQVAFTRGYETKLMQVCSLLLHINTDPRTVLREAAIPIRPPFHSFSITGKTPYRLYHMHLYPRPPIPLHPAMVLLDATTFPPDACVRSIPETAIFTIRASRQETRCFGPNCDNSLQVTGRNFQRRGGCNIVSYCGRECQTRSWKDDGMYPHKTVCSLFRDLVANGDGWKLFTNHFNTPNILNNWKMANVAEDELKYLGDWRFEMEERLSIMPDGTEWQPEFEDYDIVI